MEKIILIFPAWATPVEPCLWHKVAKDVQKTWLTFQRPSQFFVSPIDRPRKVSGQSYKASTLVNYDSRVVSISNLLVITTLGS